MADNGSYSEDISALWGPAGESMLEPPRPTGLETNGSDPEPATTNGHATEAAPESPRDGVARLAEALAGHQVDVVRHSELGALRAEMDDAFSQKLAVALYELLSASNERFSSVEDHMDRRLHDVAVELNQSISAQTDRLAAAIDTQQRMTADLARAARDELREISDRLSAPVDALAAFEREVRHEVGRVGDLVAAHNTEAVRRSEDSVKSGAALSELLAGTELRAAESLGTITERMASVQSDLTEVQGALRGLREEVSSLRVRSGIRRRWGRPG